MSARTVRGDWSESLTNAYWSAVNAPTNPEAADKVLALMDVYARVLAEKIETEMEEVRAADWGRSSRSKRPYLQGMERAKKAIIPETPAG